MKQYTTSVAQDIFNLIQGPVRSLMLLWYSVGGHCWQSTLINTHCITSPLRTHIMSTRLTRLDVIPFHFTNPTIHQIYGTVRGGMFSKCRRQRPLAPSTPTTSTISAELNTQARTDAGSSITRNTWLIALHCSKSSNMHIHNSHRRTRTRTGWSRGTPANSLLI